MIKNAKELNTSERTSLESAYKDYFKTECIFHKPFTPQVLNRLGLKLNASRYTTEMLRRIDEEKSVTFADFYNPTPDETKPLVVAFITAHQEQTKGKIDHVYFNKKIDCGRLNNRAVLLEIYSDLVKYLSDLGVKTLEATADIDDPVLVDLLESMRFSEKSSDEHDVNYEKQI